MFFQNIAMVLKITSPLDDAKGEGRLETGITWDIFEGREERKEKEDVHFFALKKNGRLFGGDKRG